MRATLATIFAMLIVSSPLVAGCDRGDDEDDESPSQVTDEEPGDPVEDGVVAAGDDFRVTIEDVEQAVERMRLVTPGEVPTDEPEWIKQPQAQATMVRNLVHFQVVRQAADERGLEPNDDEIRQVVADHPQLQRYIPLIDGEDSDDADQLRRQIGEVGLNVSDILQLAEDIAYNEAMIAHLADEFPDDKLWNFYQIAEDTADLIIATVRNTPASHEIDRAVNQYDRQIRAHFRDNRDRYQTPSKATITKLVPHGNPDLDVLQQAADRLDGDEDPAEIADDLNLELNTGVDVSRFRNPQAHQSDIGDTGVLTDPRLEPYAWKLDEFIEPERRSLDRPLRREIASKVLREQEGITPVNEQTARQARELLADPGAGEPLDDDTVDTLIASLEEQDFDVTRTGEFSVRIGGPIPELGLAENLSEAILKLDLDDPVTDLVLDRNQINVARLIDRSEPDRDQFEAERDEFRAEFIEQNESRLVSDFVEEYKEDHGIEVYPRAVAEHFGIVQPKPGAQEPMPGN